MQRVFPAQRNITRTIRPLLARMMSMPVAGDRVFDAVRDFYARLDGVRDLLTDGDVTSARLVVNAERMVVAEARRTFTYLALFGYHVDAVVVNRLLPVEVVDPWFKAWKETQAEQLDAIEAGFAPVPVLTAELASEELVGSERLAAFAETVYGRRNPADRWSRTEPFRVEPAGDALVLSMHLPFTEKHEVELGRHDGELLVAVGPHRRAVLLPDSLRRRDVGTARLEDDRLLVEFVEVGA
jgi:arsenite-transporting ATPase